MSQPDGPRLTFERIADDLKQQIRDNALRPGELLPSQSQLMKEYKASSLTVQKAMTVLRDGGWAVSKPGKGTFVSQTVDLERAYQTISADLERQIRTGDLTPGTKLPSRESLAEQYGAPLTAVDAALRKLIDDRWLTRDGSGTAPDVYVPGADDPTMASRLAYERLAKKIADGTLPEGTELTDERVADMLGIDNRTAERALSLLVVEGKGTRIRRGVPTEMGGIRVEQVVAVGQLAPVPGALETYSGPTPEELRTRQRMEHLEDVLADALEQIEEMRERVEALEAAAKPKKSTARKPS
ncbi:GntR family transcriptional regulator [Kitasatospora sp. NPDC028055]|uniref:GntR family transcriptional regulator n=1 Tax=Kitasatospora sp. NPDC028055 TaxID=3155653 RepID=UPI0033ECD00A